MHNLSFKVVNVTENCFFHQQNHPSAALKFVCLAASEILFAFSVRLRPLTGAFLW